jgi:hypothetical protein
MSFGICAGPSVDMMNGTRAGRETILCFDNSIASVMLFLLAVHQDTWAVDR